MAPTKVGPASGPRDRFTRDHWQQQLQSRSPAHIVVRPCDADRRQCAGRAQVAVERYRAGFEPCRAVASLSSWPTLAVLSMFPLIAPWSSTRLPRCSRAILPGSTRSSVSSRGCPPPGSVIRTAIARCCMLRLTGRATSANKPGVVALLVNAGADVNAHSRLASHTETPLHWAASSDDVAVLDALLDAGADIEASGAVLGGGSPLTDACGFGNWAAARRLVERGAHTRVQDAAALGLMGRVEAAFGGDRPPGPEEITRALWSACAGDQLSAARWLVERGADINWVGWDDLTPLDAAERADARDVADWLFAQGAKRAAEAIE